MSDEHVTTRFRRASLKETAYRWRVPIGILLVVILLRPVIGHDMVLGSSHIATTILIWMVFAAAYNLLLGYTGLLSFGHAMFLGMGIYGVAIGLSQFDLPYLIAAPIGVVAGAALAYGIGRLIVHRGEIYFAMLTLAFAMAVRFIANANPYGLTGGSDGLRSGTIPGWVESFRGQRLVEVGGLSFDFYFLVAIVFVIAMVALWQIVRSPFGRTLVAIRDNEELARAMGVSTRQYKVWAFTLSGAFSAVAGTLLVIRNHGAGLEDIGAMANAEVLLMAIFGGVNYFFGPLAGVFAWFVTRDFLVSFDTLHLPHAEYSLVSFEIGNILSYWLFFFGLVFVIAIMIAPREGIYGFMRGRTLAAIERIRRWRRDG